MSPKEDWCRWKTRAERGRVLLAIIAIAVSNDLSYVE